MSDQKLVFVTVGTTLFDELIRTVDSDEILQRLATLGYTRVVIQTGEWAGHKTSQRASRSFQERPLSLQRFIDQLHCCNLLDLPGKGAHKPEQGRRHGMLVECYPFKPTLTEDMQAADLIISHGGAGSIMVCSQRAAFLRQ